MITKGFILETLRWQNVSLGAVPLKYLNMIAATPLTVYDIYLHIKKEVDKKNIRKTINRLQNLGLIEVMIGKYPHNAKPYRLTTAGLFQYLLNIPVLPYALKRYEKNILLDALLYQFLEPETLTYFYSIYRIELLNRYFKRCCRAIVYRFGQYARSGWFRRRVNKVQIDFLTRDMDKIIMREIKNFIFEIAVNCKTNSTEEDFITSFTDERKESKNLSMAYSQIKGLKGVDFDTFKVSRNKYAANFDGMYPVQALGRDKRFTKILQDMKKEFIEGSEELLYLPS